MLEKVKETQAALCVTFKNSNEQLNNVISYKYGLERLGSVTWERAPSRFLTFSDPAQYSAKNLGNFVINGVLKRNDGMYQSPEFQVFHLEAYGLVLSRCPQSEEEYAQLNDANCKAGLCLMTEKEIKSSNLNHNQIGVDFAQKCGIKLLVNQPIKLKALSPKPVQVLKSIVQACQFINDMIIDKKIQPVYLFCAEGACISPTVVLAYLCIYRHMEFNDAKNLVL